MPAGGDRVGTPSFMAPEVIQCWGYGKPVDMWACGVLLFLLLGGSPPFMGTRDQLYEQIVQGRFVFVQSRKKEGEEKYLEKEFL